MTALPGVRDAERAADSVWLERTVRLGLVAYGIVHLLIAWLALQLAFGEATAAASQQGALHEIARQPVGTPLLIVIAVGFVGLAVWQLTEVVWGHRREEGAKRTFKRLGSAGRVVIYATLAYTAAQIVLNSGSSSSTQGTTSRLMEQPFGPWLVAAVGVVILVVAVVQIKRGWTKSFTHDLEAKATSGTSGTAVVRLGQVGYVAKGIAFVVLGGLFIWAAWTHDAKRAGGLDSALATLRAAGPGPWLLVAVAAGIACFGVYCFAWARYADTRS